MNECFLRQNTTNLVKNETSYEYNIRRPITTAKMKELSASAADVGGKGNIIIIFGYDDDECGWHC